MTPAVVVTVHPRGHWRRATFSMFRAATAIAARTGEERGRPARRFLRCVSRLSAVDRIASRRRGEPHRHEFDCRHDSSDSRSDATVVVHCRPQQTLDCFRVTRGKYLHTARSCSTGHDDAPACASLPRDQIANGSLLDDGVDSNPAIFAERRDCRPLQRRQQSEVFNPGCGRSA